MTATVADAMTQITQIGSRSSPISPFVAASLAHWSLLGATATARPKPPPPLMDTGSGGDSGWGAGHRELNLDKIPF